MEVVIHAPKRSVYTRGINLEPMSRDRKITPVKTTIKQPTAPQVRAWRTRIVVRSLLTIVTNLG